MSVMTGISITLGCILLAALFMVHAEEREEAYKQEQAQKAERYRRFRQWQADHKLMQDMRDETFERAVWYERIDDLREMESE